MLPLREYFTISGWEEEPQKKKTIAKLISQHIDGVASGKDEEVLLKEIERVSPSLYNRIKQVPEDHRCSAIIYVYRGATVSKPHELKDCLGFYGYLQRLREFFPFLTPDPQELFSSTQMLKACVSLMLFEGYDKKVESEISRTARKPFFFPKAKSPIRLGVSRLNYEVYVSAYGRKVSLFTTTSSQKALKLFTLYTMYQIASRIKSFINGETLESWKNDAIESLSILQGPGKKPTHTR